MRTMDKKLSLKKRYKIFSESIMYHPMMIKLFYLQIGLFFFEVAITMTGIVNLRYAIIIQWCFVCFNYWLLRKGRDNGLIKMADWMGEE